MNAVFERLNEIIPIVKLDKIQNPMTDLHGLFNCLRPDPPMGYGAFDAEDVKEVHDCSVCTNQATREVKYLTPETGKIATLYVCDECYAEDDLWEGRQLIKTIHL